MKVAVTWEDFFIKYLLTPSLTPHDVQREILAVVQSFAVLDTAYVCRARVKMQLSTDDLQIFDVNARQMQSNKAIMVQCNDRIYKFPYKMADQCSLLRAHVTASAIHIEYTVILQVDFFCYDHVYYDPMNAEEARRCLKHFVCEV